MEDSKEISVTIDITFSKDFKSDEQVHTIVSNVLKAVRRQITESPEGLTGDDFNVSISGVEAYAELKVHDGAFCQNWDAHSNEVKTFK